MAFRLSFPINSISSMRLVAKKSVAHLTATGGVAGDGSEELLVADLPNLQTDPFSVDLGDEFKDVSAAELSYQVKVDGRFVDTTESVLIEDSPETGGSTGF